VTKATPLQLDRLVIDRSPGLDRGFAVLMAPGVNLIVGPNEVGKSSLVRAVLSLLWPDRRATRSLAVTADFNDTQGPIQARYDQTGTTYWSRHDQTAPAPHLPSGHVAGCYHLGLLDLNSPAGSDLDRDLAREIRRQMSGGFDLEAVRDIFREHPRQLKSAAAARREADLKLGQVQQQQGAWADQERSLGGLRQDLARADAAQRHAEVLEQCQRERALEARVTALDSSLAKLPSQMLDVRPDDDQTLVIIQKRIREKERLVGTLTAKMQACAQDLEHLTGHDDTDKLTLLVQQIEIKESAANETDRALAAAQQSTDKARAELAPELITEGLDAATKSAFIRLSQIHRDHANARAQTAAIGRLLELPSWHELGPLKNPLLPYLATLAGASLAGAVILWLTVHSIAAAGPLLVFGLASSLVWWRGRGANTAPTPLVQVHQELQRQHDRAVASEHESAQKRSTLRADLGQDPDREDAGILHQIDLVLRCRQADQALAEATGCAQHQRQQLTALLEEAQTLLATMNIPCEPWVIAIKEGLARARQRQSQFEAMTAAQASDSQHLEELTRDLVEAREELRAFVERLHLASTEPLAPHVDRRVSALPRYHELMIDLQNSEHELAQIQARLEQMKPAPNLAQIAALTDSELARELADTTVLAAQKEELLNAITTIEIHINSARDGTALQTATAESAEREADYHHALANEHANALGRLVLDAVAHRHETDAQPPLLRATNEHLDKFVTGRYRLTVAADRAKVERFVAVDSNGQRRELAELSDGTRAQVLLAARLAFITEAEQGIMAPLFLDEALTASDPDRFQAIAVALSQLVAETGRQVFYLTSNPADAAAWQKALVGQGLPAPAVIDLGDLRGQQTSATLSHLTLPVVRPIPAPKDLSIAEYGVQLKVPLLRPWDDAKAVHVYYLCGGSTTTLQRLLICGTETLGQWLRVGQKLASTGMVDQTEAAALDARSRCWDHFLEVWRVGRSRPVTPDTLAASQALSRTMLPPAMELLEQVSGQADVFLQRLEDGAIKHFQSAKRAQLAAFMENKGHLDRRPVMTPNELVAAVVVALGEPQAEGQLEPDKIRQMVLRWAEMLR